MIDKKEIVSAKLLLAQTRNTLETLRDYQGDYERAHSIEDQMYKSIVRALASSSSQGAALLIVVAQEAIKSSEIKFPRHCA